MYSKTDILAAGLELVGWRKSNDANFSSIPSILYEVDSGYYVNDLPGVNVNLLSYVGVETNVSDYVTNLHKSELIKVIDMFLAKQKVELNTKELLTNNTLIQQMDPLERTIVRDGRFVGYSIVPRESATIVSRILQVGFISDTPQTFTLYLFDSSTKAPLETKQITITEEDTIEWTTLNWDISFDRPNGSAGQRYLIGYFEDDLSGNMYEMFWNGQCAHQSQRIFGHYMGISPIRFDRSKLNGLNRPVIEYLTSSLNCKTPGFNLRFNTKCDITKVLVDNITMFAEAVQHRIAIRILNDALSNTELNNITNARQHRETWKEMVTEYNGLLKGGITEAGIPVKGIIDRLSIDFSQLDAVCLKNRKGQVSGVKW